MINSSMYIQSINDATIGASLSKPYTHKSNDMKAALKTFTYWRIFLKFSVSNFLVFVFITKRIICDISYSLVCIFTT